MTGFQVGSMFKFVFLFSCFYINYLRFFIITACYKLKIVKGKTDVCDSFGMEFKAFFLLEIEIPVEEVSARITA
jgi:hypothetical protein